jgi:type I restriction enzyme S subunit
MNAIQTLLTENIGIWTAADTEKKSGRGRASGNSASVYGIKKLRELILELAVRGKLVPQDTNDEPASALLKRIQVEKAELIAEGKIKKDKPLAAIEDEEKPFELPNGWNWVRLNELLSKIGAGSTPLGGKQVYVNEGVPFLRSQNIWDEGLRLDDVAYITPEIHQKMSGTHICAGDLLFNITGASIGRCAIVPENFEIGNVSQHVTIVRSASKDVLLFLHLVLISKHVQQTVMDVQVGVSREGLSIGKLGQFIIPIPPLAEQHRIVAKVDELMSLCDQLEARHSNAAEAHEKLVNHLLGTLAQSQDAEDFSAIWQRIAVHFDTLFTTEASIDVLKQTLLQLAVMGKLVTQDPNDEPASQLLKRIQVEKAKLVAEGKIKKDKPLAEITDDVKPFDLPQGWEWVNLSDLLALVTDGDHQAPPKADSGVPFLVIGNLNTGNVSLEDCRFVPTEYYEALDWGKKPKNNDLLYTVTGSYGIPIKVESPEIFCVQRHVAILKTTKSTPINYLVVILKSKYALQYAAMVATGIAQKTVPLTGLRIMPIATPPEAEQRRIVEKIDELMALCDQLKTRITQANQLQQKLADVMIEQAVA